MKQLTKLFGLLFILLSSNLFSQDIVFYEDFEGVLKVTSSSSSTAKWEINSRLYSQGSKCDSASVTPGDTTYLTTDAFSTKGKHAIDLYFNHICKVAFKEGGYIEVSNDDGKAGTWKRLDKSSYRGTVAHFENKFNVGSYGQLWQIGNSTASPDNSWWKPEHFMISDYAANADKVRIRFVIYDDNSISGSEGHAGWFIDSIKVTAAFSESVPPQISLLKYIPENETFGGTPQTVRALVSDISGVTASVIYTVNSGTPITLQMNNISGDTFSIDIPFTAFGDEISYYVKAVDKSPKLNTDSSSIYSFTYTYSDATQANVGNCTGHTYFAPIHIGISTSNNKYSNHISLYTSEELESGGLIEKIAWNKANNVGYIGSDAILKIYFKNTKLQSLENIKTSFTEQLDDATLVYSSDKQNINTSVGWQEFVLDNVYNYNGDDNLMVLVDWNYPGIATGNKAEFCYGIQTNMALGWVGSAYPPSTTKIKNIKPDIKLSFKEINIKTDLSIVEISSPKEKESANIKFPINISIKNNGSDTIVNAIINWSIDGVAKPAFNWFGSLPSDSTINEITLDSISLSSGSHQVSICISKVNGTTDQNRENNCITKKFVICSNPLNGIYTINPNGSGTNNYLSFEDAANTLNNCGISGPVTFNVAPDTYNEQFEIKHISGISSTNTVTFISTSSDSTAVKVEYDATLDKNFIVKLDSCSHISFKKIYFESTNYKLSRVFELTKGTNNIQLQSCIIKQKHKASIHSRNQELIYGNGPLGDTIVVENCFLSNGSTVATLEAKSSGSTGWIFRNNMILGHYQKGLEIIYAKSINIENNTIIAGSTYKVDGYEAILLSKNYGSPIIIKNKIYTQRTSFANGIRIKESVFDITKPALIANNFISLSQTTTAGDIGSGINIQGQCINVFFNNILIHGDYETSAAFKIDQPNDLTKNIKLINNNLINLAGGYAAAINVKSSSSIKNHHNNLFSNASDKLCRWGTINYNSVSSWQIITSDGQGSINFDPYFLNNKDLYVQNLLMKHSAISLAEIDKDIDDKIRDTIPDIGAVEIERLDYDAYNVGIINMRTGCGLSASEEVVLSINNLGSKEIDGGLKAYYKLYATQNIISEDVNTKIAPGDTLDYIFKNTVDLNRKGKGSDTTFIIETWIELNGDPITQNDNVTSSIFSGETPDDIIGVADTVDYGQTAIIKAQGNHPYYWTSDTASIQIGEGSSYTTPELYDTTTYWVNDRLGSGNKTIQLGSGSSRFPYAPICGIDGYSWSKMLYTSSELKESGNIESIFFEVDNQANTTLNNQRIYMKTVSYSTFTDNTYENPSSMTKVVEGTVVLSGSSWIEVKLDKPYYYDGVGNLLIQWDNLSGQGGIPFFKINNISGKTVAYSSLTSFDGLSTVGTPYPVRPNTKLHFNALKCFGTRTPVTVIVNKIPDFDIGILSINTPVSKTDLTTFEDVEIELKNYAKNTIDTIPLAYQIDDNLIVYDTLFYTLKGGESIKYTFRKKGNFSKYKTHTFRVFSHYGRDDYRPNDTIETKITNKMLTYCGLTPFIESSGDISKVSMGSIDNATEPVGNKYSDFSTTIPPAVFLVGDTIEVTVATDKVGQYTLSPDLWINIFIDYNHDAIFDKTSELAFSQKTTLGAIVNGQIIIPTQGIVKYLPSKMRVVMNMSYNATKDNTGPCGSFTTGEVEDYSVFFYTPIPEDAGIVDIVPNGPIVSGTPIDIEASIRNYGTNKLKKANIFWQIDNGNPYSKKWTGDLDTLSIFNNYKLTQHSFTNGKHTIRAWAEMPNDSIDYHPFNDTLNVEIFGCDEILNGSYTIGGTNPDFQTIDTVLYTLKHCGVNGHVTFNIRPGVYENNYEFTDFIGLSENATVTFQSSTANKSDVIIKYQSSYFDDNYVIQFYNTSYVNIKNITLKAEGKGTYANVIVFKGENNNNTIEGCDIQSNFEEHVKISCIYSYSKSGSYNKFINNTIHDGYKAINWNGEDSVGIHKGNHFEGNTISNFYEFGAYFSSQDSLIFKNNTIKNDLLECPTASTALKVSRTKNSTISANKINMSIQLNSAKGIYLGKSINDSLRPTTVSNNSITCSSNLKDQHGITTSLSEHVNIFYNSVNIYGSNKNSAPYYSLSDDKINILNNIFANQQGGYSIYVKSPQTINSIDYNAYYTSGDNIAYWDADIVSLKNLQSVNNMDKNSINIDPVYHSYNNLLARNPILVEGAKPIIDITTDIDNKSRNLLKPTIGAYEFTAKAKDIGVEKISQNNLNKCIGNSETIAFVIRNYGKEKIDFAKDTTTLYSKESGSNPTIFKSVKLQSGILLSGEDTTIIVSSNYDMSANGIYIFEAHTKMYNDQNSSNDTMQITSLDIISTITKYPYFEGFESSVPGNPGIITNGWQRDIGVYNWVPTNIGITNPLSGPVTDHSGNGIYIYNRQNYETGEAIITSPCIDLSSLKNPALKYWYYMFGKDIGILYVQALDSNGKWVNIDNIIGEQQKSKNEAWRSKTIMLNDFKNNITKIRFVTANPKKYNSTIALDDISISNLEQYDIGISEIVAPTVMNSIVGTKINALAVKVKNYGWDTIKMSDNAKINYSYDGQAPVSMSLSADLLPNQTQDIVFAGPNSLLKGLKSLKIYTDLSSDTEKSNDTLNSSLRGLKTINIPYSNDFEGFDEFFSEGEDNIWEKGIPIGNNINNAQSGTNVWMTGLTKSYKRKGKEYLYTPYFNFSNLPSADTAILSFNWWADANTNDGVNIEYTTNGSTWLPLGYKGDQAGTNWYNHSEGGVNIWSNVSNNWEYSSYKFYQADNTNKTIQFRFVFHTNTSSQVKDGFAIDNFKIVIPLKKNDAGVIAINKPTIATEVSSLGNIVEITVKNHGLDTLYSIPVHYAINGAGKVSETLTIAGGLLPDSVKTYEFTTSYQGPYNEYQLCAFTDDINRYNDTACANIGITAPPVDVSVTNLLLSPSSGDTTFMSDVKTEVSTYIKNTGTTAISNIPLYYSINGNIIETDTFVGTINPGDSVLHTFEDKFYSPLGYYSVCVETMLSGDQNPTNNKYCKQILGIKVDNINESLGISNFTVQQNEPNPASNVTLIKYFVPNSGKINFTLTNTLGQHVYSLEQNSFSGNNHLRLNVSEFPAGVYYYTVTFENSRITRKLIIK